ncbi:MAG TPA: sigma-70 family RNA polymerase sigma factor [Conexibacter sp.]
MTPLAGEARATPPRAADATAWRRALRAPGAERDAALARLHASLLTVARREARRRAAAWRISGPELDDLAHQAAADALLAVDRKLDQFRGESRFTTWACQFAILETSNKLRRHFWRAPRVALDASDWDLLPDRPGLDPAMRSEWNDEMAVLRTAIDRDLTDRQRMLFVAIALNDEPLDALAAELGTNRNAIYKNLFDARRKLRSTLVANGYGESP